MAAYVQASGGGEGHRLRVASLNVWGLAWPLSRDLPQRIGAIGEALDGLGADIVAFQEVWTETSGLSLIESGRAAGLPHVWNGQQTTGGSGLVVLSRTPIEQVRFEPFLTRGLPQRISHGDYWGGKGFGRLRIETAAGPIVFANTHLHAQYDDDGYPEYKTHRMGQSVQFAARLAEEEAPIVAAGDFNMHADSPEYSVLTGLTGLRDAALEAGAPLPTSLGSNPYNSRLKRDARIDYLFVRDGTDRSVRVRRLERIFDADLEIGGRPAAFSDHAGVLAELQIEPAPAPRTAHRPQRVSIDSAREVLRQGIELARQRQGSDRRNAAVALGLGGLAVAARRSDSVTRRNLLRRCVSAVAGLAAGSALGLGALTEFAIRREVRDYRDVERLLDALADSGRTA